MNSFTRMERKLQQQDIHLKEGQWKPNQEYHLWQGRALIQGELETISIEYESERNRGSVWVWRPVLHWTDQQLPHYTWIWWKDVA